MRTSLGGTEVNDHSSPERRRCLVTKSDTLAINLYKKVTDNWVCIERKTRFAGIKDAFDGLGRQKAFGFDK